MRTRPAPATPLVIQVSDITSGVCPRCDAPAYAHEVDGVDGPFHACGAHRLAVALDLLWDPVWDPDNEVTTPFARRPT